MLRPASAARFALPLLAALALAACGRGNDANDLAAIDNALANEADPALTSAIEDQILVDPNLVDQANATSARSPAAPIQAQYPADAPAAAARQARQASGASGSPATASSGCGAAFQFGPEWASRLPGYFPPYPGGRVTEAAGADGPDCRVRVVTFRTGDAYARVLDHYRSLAGRAGFSAEHQRRGADHMLGGVNRGTDAAFVVIVTPMEGGSDVALIVNHGR